MSNICESSGTNIFKHYANIIDIDIRSDSNDYISFF